ncbi:CPBP family intramembrane glutamic endopeptidase [Deinococcus roseus]|uniref:CAAX prenyl protease 2/Lysostaphin resistance protein A-like domain-containing protein n=1 Tax=Deinococcus roseus TaxID=392414 RepID=A0ABQ2D003_9DEIO|nr:CPBP family intramembrane glutamic endopeptidase [Deinococcus roseus]GGJ37356.1 hypothetical protein GCM10008938_24330 [Deinococcus roseus]
MTPHEQLIAKYVMVSIPILVLVYGILSPKVKDVELNHITASLFAFLMPVAYWNYLPTPKLLQLMLVYVPFFLASTLLILHSPVKRMPLDGRPLLDRILTQLCRIINEEALFRGLMFALPAVWLPEVPWYWIALPQALLFAIIHYIPVRSVLKGQIDPFMPFFAAFAFPLFSSMMFAYLVQATHGILLAVVIHWLTNVVIELMFQRLGYCVVFELGLGNQKGYQEVTAPSVT